jgi:hypothetical protein
MTAISGAPRLTSYGVVLAAISLHALGQDASKLFRERTPEQRPALMILGTGHFRNPGRDVVNLKVDDVLSEARQAQIAEVVEQLAAFRPTHVAVEWPRTDQSTLDAHYRDYREGHYRLSRAEEDQLGVRLAAKLGLARVYAVDWNDLPPGDQKSYDWYSYGQSHGQKTLVSAIVDPNRSSWPLAPLGTQSIGTWLLQLNRREVIAADHRNYFDIAIVGDEDQQPGANWVGYWYGRNLRIFNNLVRLSDRPQDRVLAVYGQGHAYLLRQFATESGAFRLIDVEAVLTKGQ